MYSRIMLDFNEAKSTMFIDSTTTTKRLWLAASNITNGTARLANTTDWRNAGGLEIATSPTTGATSFTTRVKDGTTANQAHVEIAVAGDLTFDSANDIFLDADGGDILFQDSGTNALYFSNSSGDWTIKNVTSNKDIIFNVNDGGANTEVMRLDGDVSAVKVANIVYFAAETANTIGNGATGTIDWNVSQKQKVTITGTGITCNFTNPAGACNLLLKVVQGDGSDVIATWDGDIKWAGSAAPTLSTGNGEIDILSFYFDGSNYFGVASLDFATP